MKTWWQDSCDDMIAGVLKLIQSYGTPYSVLCILAAIILPIVTIIAGTGYSTGLSIVHTILFMMAVCGAIMLFRCWGMATPLIRYMGVGIILVFVILPIVVHIPGAKYSIGLSIPHLIFFTAVVYGIVTMFRYKAMMAPTARKVLTPLSVLISMILFLGILDYTKPIAVIVGLLLSQLGLAYIMLVGSGLVLTYGLALAMTPAEDVGDAQERSSGAWKQFIGIAAWECFAAWYIVSLGQYMSLYASAFVICAAGVILYGGIAWGLMGDLGLKTVYYGAIAGCIGVTLDIVHRMLTGRGLVEGNQWATILKAAVDIKGHTLEWFVAIAVTLALGFLISEFTGKKKISENVTLVTVTTSLIFFLAWFGWFGGLAVIQALLHKMGTAAAPSWNMWRGIIRFIILIVTGPWLVYNWYMHGLCGLGKRLVWVTLLVYLPWLFVESVIWRWGPLALFNIETLIDLWVGSQLPIKLPIK